MKPHDLKALDETDTRVLRDRLQLHCANLRGLVHTTQGQLLTRPKLSADGDVLSDIRTLEAHASDLESRLGTSAPIFSAARDAVTQSESSVGKLNSPPSKKLSLTERVLKARGVGSLSALREKLVDTTPEERTKSARRLKTSA
jgi:hypothetical protein